MIVGEQKAKADPAWDAFRTGGISNSLEVMEQIAYLFFLRLLDDEEANALNRASLTKQPIIGKPFPVDREELRWSILKGQPLADIFNIAADQAVPLIKTMGDSDSTYAHFMKDATPTRPCSRARQAGWTRSKYTTLTQRATSTSTSSQRSHLLARMAIPVRPATLSNR